MAKKEILELGLPDGRHFMVKELKFEIVKEEFNEYTADDGIMVKVKSVVGKMFVEVDGDGNIKKTPDGDPNVIIRSTNLVYSSD